MIDTNHVVLGQVFRKTIVLQPIVEVGYITTRPDKDKYKDKEKDGQTTDSRQPLCFIKKYISTKLLKVQNKSFCLLFRLTINRTLMYTNNIVKWKQSS